MRIATWNVNSVRARLPRVLDWLETAAPDVVCLQELKCQDGQFPAEPIEALGYQCAIYGQKTYNGVAILSKRGMEDVQRGFEGDPAPDHARVITAQVEDLLVVNLYVVNGKEVGDEKYALKLAWLDALIADLRNRYGSAIESGERVMVTGDFNITFDDRDIYDPEAWRDKILCSQAERDRLQQLCDLGLEDALRKHHDEEGIYTWWDFRTRGFQRGNGLRIDHFLLSNAALGACSAVEVDTEERGQEKPSDHAPVIATID